MDPNNLDTSSAPSGGAADSSASAAAPAAPAAPASNPETASAPAAGTPVEATGPKSMLEAVEASLAPKAVDGTPAKPADPAAPAAAKPELGPDGKPIEKADPAEDPTQMPEGLSAKAQERFQKLANTNKELKTRFDQVQAQIEPFRAQLQEHGVTREQFSVAASYVGLVNKGDYAGALKVLDEERRQIALMTGQPLPGVDALAQFPDLREAVDQFQMTEQNALELARNRAQHQQQQQAQQSRQVQAQQQQREEQQAQAGTQAVDAFCRRMEAADLDFKAVEAILLPQIQQGLLNGIDPARWAGVVEQAYKMIKSGGAQVRTQQPGANTLRPTGSASPSAAPKSMHEAMWGAPQA